MALEPAGCLSLPLSYLRDQIANCDSFQALVGADDATEAKAKITYGYAEDEDDPLTLPRCVVRLADEIEINPVSTGSYNQSSTLIATFEALPPTGNEDVVTESDQYLWWLNFIGYLLKEMREQRFDSGALDSSVKPFNIGIVDDRKENGVKFLVGALMVMNEGLP